MYHIGKEFRRVRRKGYMVDRIRDSYERDLLLRFNELNVQNKQSVIAALLMFLSAQEGSASDRQ